MIKLFILLMLPVTLSSCISHRLDELEYKMETLDMRLDFEVWNNEAEHCYLGELTLEQEEACEIAAYKKWKTIREYKEGGE